jgi:hypothetical protein
LFTLRGGILKNFLTGAGPGDPRIPLLAGRKAPDEVLIPTLTRGKNPKKIKKFLFKLR